MDGLGSPFYVTTTAEVDHAHRHPIAASGAIQHPRAPRGRGETRTRSPRPRYAPIRPVHPTPQAGVALPGRTTGPHGRSHSPRRGVDYLLRRGRGSPVRNDGRTTATP